MFKKFIIFALLVVALSSCSGRRTSTVEPSGDTVEVELGTHSAELPDSIAEKQRGAS